MAVDPRTIRYIPFFADLPEAAVADLAAMAVLMRRAAGSFLFLRGDPAPGLYVVTDGRVKLTRESAGGREQVLHVVVAGEHFNAVPVFDGGPCPANAQALGDVTLILFPNDVLRAATRRHPDLAVALLNEFGVFLRRLVNLVDDLALHTVQGRLARLLLERAEAAADGTVPGPLTQAEMAARLGTVREMVGRTLKTFEGLGLITIERGAITVRDRAGLEAQSEE